MAKKKKKKKASPAQQKSKVVVNTPRVRAEIVKQLSANAGRKAMAQAEKLGASTVYSDADDAPLCSMACEFAIRELLQNGNEKALRASFRRIRNLHPEWLQQWPMALRVLGEDVELTEDSLTDPSFRQAIRGSLRDPDELKYCSHAATRDDVTCIQQAVAWVKQMDYRAAATALKSIGRQSLLIDWRLYVQALIADQLNDQSALSANLQRMQPDAPITSLAKQLFTDKAEYAEAAAASYDCVRKARSKRIKPRLMRLQTSIAGQDVDTAMLQVADECDQLVSEGRIALAVMLMVAAYSELNYGHERMAPMLRERYESTDPRQYWRYCLRCIKEIDSEEEGLAWDEELEGYYQSLIIKNWSRYERAKLVLDFLQLMKEVTEQAYGNDVQAFFDDTDYGYEECMQLLRIGVECWPTLDALFEMWIWMDQLYCPGQSRALEVWHKLMPSNVDVLERYIHEQARRRQFRKVDRLLLKLQRMPGAKDAWRKCMAFVLMLQAEAAMAIDDRKTMLSLAARGNELKVFSQWQQLQLLAWNALTEEEEQEEDIRKELFNRAGNPWLVLLLFAITEVLDSPDDLSQAMDDELDARLIPQNAAEADEIARQFVQAVEQIDVSERKAVYDSLMSYHVERLMEELETPEMICAVLEILLMGLQNTKDNEFPYEVLCVHLSARLVGDSDWIAWGLCFQAVFMVGAIECHLEDDPLNQEMLVVFRSYAELLIRIASLLDDTDAACQQLIKKIEHAYQLKALPLDVPKRSINKIVKLHKKAVNAGQLMEAIMAGTPELVKLLEKQEINETQKRKK